VHQTLTPDLLYDWLPVCSATFPLCGLLLQVLPPPTGVSAVAAAALASVFCLLAVGVVSLLRRASLGIENGWVFGYCIVGGISALAILIGVFTFLARTPFEFRSAFEYVGFFAGISFLFAYIRHAAVPTSSRSAS